MMRALFRGTAVGAAFICGMASPGFAGAQQPAPASAQMPADGEVLGSSHFSPVVQDLDKSIEFYGGLLGLAVPPPREPGPRPWDTQQTLRDLQGLPDTSIRYTVAAIPGERWGVELIEFQDSGRRPLSPRVQDPGASMLVFLVRDVDAAFAPLRQAGVPVVTAGGAPIKIDAAGTAGRGVVVKDPDGHFVELLQPDAAAETTAPAASNIVGARVRVTVEDTDQTMHLFRDLLGLHFQVGTFVKDQQLARLMGVKGAATRRSTLDSPMLLEFIEFKGVDRKPLHTRISDPGSTKYPLRVRDLDAAISKLKSTGATVVSLNGQPTVVRNVRYAIVHGLDNLFLIVTQVAPPRPAP
jgi:catechol 2,3-dioxygenase-like lactoylglutathione lyase family enzyme